MRRALGLLVDGVIGGLLVWVALETTEAQIERWLARLGERRCLFCGRGELVRD